MIYKEKTIGNKRLVIYDSQTHSTALNSRMLICDHNFAPKRLSAKNLKQTTIIFEAIFKQYTVSKGKGKLFTAESEELRSEMIKMFDSIQSTQDLAIAVVNSKIDNSENHEHTEKLKGLREIIESNAGNENHNDIQIQMYNYLISRNHYSGKELDSIIGKINQLKQEVNV